MAAIVIDAYLASAGTRLTLGNDPSHYTEKFEEWTEQMKLTLDTVGVRNDDQKLNLLLLWGGKELRDTAKEAGVKDSVSQPNDHDTSEGAITKITNHLNQYVNYALAMYELMNAKQGEKSVAEYQREIKLRADRVQFVKRPYTKDIAMRDAYIFGTSDEKLRKEALAKDLPYTDLIKSATSYEQARKSSTAIASGDTTKRVYTQNEVDELVAKVQIAGKYSNRYQPERTRDKGPVKCPNCPPHYRPHPPDRCPARGQECAACKERNHFAKSAACKAKTRTLRRVTDIDEEYVTPRYLETIEIGRLSGSDGNSVQLKANGSEIRMIVDSGCRKTLLPEQTYKYDEAFGPLQPTGIRLRPYGTNQTLPVRGQISVTLESANGAQHKTTAYIVDGPHTEPLLGDEDAKALGILRIEPRGYDRAQKAARQENAEQAVNSIQTMVKDLGILVNDRKDPTPPIPAEERRRIDNVVTRYDEVFKGTGLLKNEEIKFHIDETVAPASAPYRPVPLAYRDAVSQHLEELRQADKIEDVDPSEDCPWISNVVITHKKQAGQIRMNIDMQQPNRAIKRTKTHVQTVQEMRHMLKKATRFSELDMKHGFHQVALAEDSRYISTFRTHEGLHRYKVLFFGATCASDLFHDKISKAMHGLKGCTTIHDNILVWGTSPEDHEKNLEACLQRLGEKGLTLRREKCNIGATSVSWFGWVFSPSGMSADPNKLSAIRQAGRPESCPEVKSFLQSCQFNAKFAFDSEEAYAQTTKPLRNLTKRNARFGWTEECEAAYQKIVANMTSDTALRPYDPKKETVHIADAGPTGIAASVYQVEPDGTWTPIDHTSRSLTQTEQRYSQTEKESLAQSWGMNTHRYYLLGTKFTSYTDHQPLLPIYNTGRTANLRVNLHRHKVQGFDYVMKYISGDKNPCDYASRHPAPLEKTPTNEEEICINSIITDDLPDAVTLEMVKAATAHDPQTRQLMQDIKKGYISNSELVKPFRGVFHELCEHEGVILRNNKLMIPATAPDGVSLRPLVIDIAHEGHQGEVKTKRYLRTRVWFPGMDKSIEEKIVNCLACQATTYTPTREPLRPTELPKRAWQNVDADFWGPLPNSNEYVLVLIDERTRWPEVAFVSSTAATAVVPHLDRIFSQFGFPETLKTDGGPPFNGHQLTEYLRWAGVKHRIVTPENPEANGLAENFMKMVTKVYHAAKIEGKVYKQELYKYLRNYRSTPHSSTGVPPAEAMLGRQIKTRLPENPRPIRETTPTDRKMETDDANAKAKQKQYKDDKKYVKPHNIVQGDQVLLLQRKNKSTPQYDPRPFTVTHTKGSQITATRRDKVRTRDAKKFKRYNPTQPPRSYGIQRRPYRLQADDWEEPETVTNDRRAAPIPGMDQAHALPDPAGGDRNQERNARQYEYPNEHLNPYPDPNLPRDARRRMPPIRLGYN